MLNKFCSTRANDRQVVKPESIHTDLLREPWRGVVPHNGEAAPIAELVFIDPDVSDTDVLLAGMRPNVEPHLLNSRTPAMSQIAAALQGRTQLAAVHIVGHGQPGEVGFSAGRLSVETLHQHISALSRIGEAISSSGVLALWSCDTGRGKRGAAFVSSLRCATGTVIAAAAGKIGSLTLGGRWELEQQFISTIAAPLTSIGMAAYPGLLPLNSASVTSITSDTGSSATDFITTDPTLVLNGTVANKTSNNVLNIWLSGGTFGGGVRVGQINLAPSQTAVPWSFDLATSSVLAARNLADGKFTITLNKSATRIKSGVLSARSLVVDTTRRRRRRRRRCQTLLPYRTRVHRTRMTSPVLQRRRSRA